MSEWKKGISKAGKIRTTAFSAILTAIYPSQIKTGTGILQLDFDDGSNIGIFGIDKATITDDGVEVGGSLADFQESLEALGYECFWGEMDGVISGFKTEPDIIGSKIWIEPLEEQTVGDDTQTKKSVFWGIVTKVEKSKSTAAAPKPKPKPTSKSTKPAPTKSNNVDEITQAIIDEALEDKGVGEIYQHFKKKYQPSDIRAALSIITGA